MRHRRDSINLTADAIYAILQRPDHASLKTSGPDPLQPIQLQLRRPTLWSLDLEEHSLPILVENEIRPAGLPDFHIGDDQPTLVLEPTDDPVLQFRFRTPHGRSIE